MMKLIIVLAVFALLAGCGQTRVVTVPVETIREVEVMNHVRDSIYLHDSIVNVIRGDTVWITSYRYLYRDKVVKDTLKLRDSIPVIQEVQVPGPVTNELTSLQGFQLWCGRGALLALAIYFGKRYLRSRVGV
jgi:hypothetical protein